MQEDSFIANQMMWRQHCRQPVPQANWCTLIKLLRLNALAGCSIALKILSALLNLACMQCSWNYVCTWNFKGWRCSWDYYWHTSSVAKL